MKIVLWIGDKSNQRALANKIHILHPIAGIIAESRVSKTKITFDKVIEKLFLSSISASWQNMQAYFDRYFPGYPDTKILKVQNINSEEAYKFTQEINPDLIIVSGTRMVKQKMLSFKPSIGILNLHTGLSPYIKGGPNATNWCIATGQFHLIGNTIMWIDIGVDTGNIVTTEQTEFVGDEDFLGVHIKVMEHGHALYIKAIDKLINGIKSNVKQDSIATGKTYTNKEWGLREKFKLLQNFGKFRKTIKSPEFKRLKEEVKTIKI